MARATAIITGRNARDRRRRVVRLNLIIFVGNFAFEANRPDIIADDAIDIEARILVLDAIDIVDGADVDRGILDDHAAAFDADIPGAVFGERWASQSRSREHCHKG